MEKISNAQLELAKEIIENQYINQCLYQRMEYYEALRINSKLAQNPAPVTGRRVSNFLLHK